MGQQAVSMGLKVSVNALSGSSLNQFSRSYRWAFQKVVFVPPDVSDRLNTPGYIAVYTMHNEKQLASTEGECKSEDEGCTARWMFLT